MFGYSLFLLDFIILTITYDETKATNTIEIIMNAIRSNVYVLFMYRIKYLTIPIIHPKNAIILI